MCVTSSCCKTYWLSSAEWVQPERKALMCISSNTERHGLMRLAKWQPLRLKNEAIEDPRTAVPQLTTWSVVNQSP